MAYKPDFVPGSPPSMTIHLGPQLPARSCNQPGPAGAEAAPGLHPRGPYSVLLPAGLAKRALLPEPRWALTPPFHRDPLLRSGAGRLFSVALSLGFPRAGVTRRRRFLKSGLSSGVAHAVIQPSARGELCLPLFYVNSDATPIETRSRIELPARSAIFMSDDFSRRDTPALGDLR